jgi:ABC-2 type transport system ATP-binding protein
VSAATPLEMPEPAAIRVRHLWHRFGMVEVLRDVTFEVGPGEIFGFIGPNGAGKTTTIRVMATLLEPMAGRVEIDGLDVTLNPDEVRRRIGYMPDTAGVYERITVREYLEFFADAFQVQSIGIVDTVLELTDMSKIQDRLVATMSKGQKQRLQLGRILLHDPKVLILDEPASDLDPRARIEIRDLLVELRSMGKTIFLSSHILTELADVCTSVAILERGRLVVSGPISDIARRLETAQAQQTQQAPPPPPDVGPVPTGAAPSEWAAPEPPPPPTVVLPTRNVRIKALAPGEAVYAALVSMQGIHSVSPGPAGSVVVKYTGDEQMVAGIVRALVLGNIPVVGVEPERNELERIFLEVTKGEVQ